MQYIKKANQPPEQWDHWFTRTDAKRSYDYGNDIDVLPNREGARLHLLTEQNYLCAYCQKKLTLENSSIEHVLPKSLNKELSTNYFNLVAVCKSPLPDPNTKRLHCDKEKGDKIIPPLLFLSNSDCGDDNHAWFYARADGSIEIKHPKNVQSGLAAVFMETLNLIFHIVFFKVTLII